METTRRETAGAASPLFEERAEAGPERPGRGMVIAALIVAMAVAAMEQLVVSPAMPTIIVQLHGFDIYPWVISAYLLAATVSTPLYGKLADLHGRKPILLIGLGLFSAGSVLSGLAHSMSQLIAMRTLQGLGAGAVMPIVLTMLGDLFTLEERARVQGLFSAVWGLSSIAGPVIGGYLTESPYFGWRWVFLVCVPFAVIAIALLAWFVHEPAVKRKVAPIDWAGASLLTIGLSSLLLAVLDGPRHGMVLAAGLFVAALVALVLFVARERVAEDPILPIDIMTRPPIAASLIGSCLIGGMLFGIETYVPLYIQGVGGGDARSAGRALMPLFISWSISVVIAARVVARRGFRLGGLAGGGLITAGAIGLVIGSMVPAWSSAFFFVALVLVGLGMGPTSLSYVLSVQHSVSWNQRGAATGAAVFLRTIGGALGVGVLGAALGWELAHRLVLGSAAGVDVAAALRPETHRLLRPDQLLIVQAELGRSLRDVYLQVTALGMGAMLCSRWLPNQEETLASAVPQNHDQFGDEGYAVAVSEI